MLKVESLGLADAICEHLCNCETFTDAFCEDCAAIERLPQTLTDPADETCPAEFDVSDPGCVRHSDWFEIAERAREAEKLAAEAAGIELKRKLAA